MANSDIIFRVSFDDQGNRYLIAPRLLTETEFQELREELLLLAQGKHSYPWSADPNYPIAYITATEKPLTLVQLEEKFSAELAEHADEDIYKLEQMKQLASDLYSQRMNSHGGATKGDDKYAYHIGEAIQNLDGAIAERKTEKEVLDGLREQSASSTSYLKAEFVLPGVLDHYGLVRDEGFLDEH